MVQLAGHHPDRQRQVPAQPGDLADRRIGRAEPGPGGQPDQQRGGLTGRQGVQADRRRVIQRGQVAAAGDQHQAPAGAGQQRPDLLAAGRVIEHQQQLLPGQPVPPQRHPRLQPRRDLRGGNPGGQQQAGQRVTRVDRPLPGRVPVQRQEDLPGREPVGQPVRGVHRERGLADPGHPPDRMNADHPARTRRGIDQLGQLLLPPGERGDVAGQRPRRRRGPARHGAQRRELRLQARRSELEDPLWTPQILQPVHAQVPQRRARRKSLTHQGGRRLRQQHLAPMPGGCHPGGAMHIQAHQAGGRRRRLTGMDTHPYPDVLPCGPRMCLQGLLHLDHRRHARRR